MISTKTTTRDGSIEFRLFEMEDGDTWEWQGEIPNHHDVVLYQPAYYTTDGDNAGPDDADMVRWRCESRTLDGKIVARSIHTPPPRMLPDSVVEEIRRGLAEEIAIEASGTELVPPTRYELREDLTRIGVLLRPDVADTSEIGYDVPAWLGTITSQHRRRLCIVDIGNGAELATFTHPDVSVTQYPDGRIILDTGRSGVLPSGSTFHYATSEVRYIFGTLEWVPVR